MSKKPLDHARDEMIETIDGLRSAMPGLQVSVLVSIPDGQGDINASFFSTHEIEHAARMMRDAIHVGTREPVSNPNMPEAS